MLPTTELLHKITELLPELASTGAPDDTSVRVCVSTGACTHYGPGVEIYCTLPDGRGRRWFSYRERSQAHAIIHRMCKALKRGGFVIIPVEEAGALPYEALVSVNVPVKQE